MCEGDWPSNSFISWDLTSSCGMVGVIGSGLAGQKNKKINSLVNWDGKFSTSPAWMLALKFQLCLSLEQISAKSREFSVNEAPELCFLLLINCCGVFSFELYLVKGKKIAKLGWKKARQKTGHLSLSLLYGILKLPSDGILKLPSERNRWCFLWSIFQVGVFAQ